MTLFELLVEFYEDIFEDNSDAMLDAARDEDGEVYFEETGDPLIDKWEREIRMGIEPDLGEAFSTEERKKLDKEKEKFRRAREARQQLDGIDERFDQAIKEDPRYAHKTANVGSRRDNELLGRGTPPNISRKDVLGSG